MSKKRDYETGQCVAEKPHLQGCSSFFGLWHKTILDNQQKTVDNSALVNTDSREEKADIQKP